MGRGEEGLLPSGPEQTAERFDTVPSHSADTGAARRSAWERRRKFLKHYYDALRRMVTSNEETLAGPSGWIPPLLSSHAKNAGLGLDLAGVVDAFCVVPGLRILA